MLLPPAPTCAGGLESLPMTGISPVLYRAAPAQAARLSQIAIAAKSYWGYPAQWIELWHDQLTISPTYVAHNEVWAAEFESAILGFYALRGQPPQLTLDHMWVMPVAIKQGIGTALILHAMTRAAAIGATMIQIESDPHAEAFYTKMGAECVGEVGYVLEGQRRALPLLELHLQPKNSGESAE